MNENLNQERLDKLVDGTLSEAERRQLLMSLDGQPDGWRRCALAFLEAQCWKEAFRGLDAPSSTSLKADTLPPADRLSDSGEATLASRTARRSPWRSRAETLLAMAASFLVVLWLGSWAQRAWRGEGLPGSSGEVARTQPPRSIPVDQSQPRPIATPAANPWRVVTVSSPSNGRSVKLPAVERNRLDEQWLRSVGPAMPDEVLQALNRSGHQVEQRRELVPFPLPDGRRLVVPVDQVDVHYVGNETY